MKKSKKLGLQSLALVLMAFVLVAGVAFGMTGAWFTDTQTQANNSIVLGAHVEIDNFSLAAPTISGTRANGSGTIAAANNIALNAVMPGDTITFAFNLDKVASTSDYVARMNITAVYDWVDANSNGKYDANEGTVLTTSGTKITFTQKVDNVDYTNDTDIIVDHTRAVEIKAVLNGAEFANADALKKMAFVVKVDAIQAANYVADNWTGTTIVEYTAPVAGN